MDQRHSVLPGFSKIELGGGSSDALESYGGAHCVNGATDHIKA